MLLGWLLLLTVARPEFAQQRVDDRFSPTNSTPFSRKPNAACATTTMACLPPRGCSSSTPEAKTEAIRIFGLKLSVLVDRNKVAQSLLLNKPTLRIPHTGG